MQTIEFSFGFNAGVQSELEYYNTNGGREGKTLRLRQLRKEILP